ncbi:hypothetical protein M422DRAFT_273415 [Sphaerobolus stellatus SS14]|uniref:Uncharacterized protein n=1 Tax=Sphaerobolus stellatus (strain SS14) TaxID=990650 RepID=A0A0C9U968_SPHS4|nr:hypothetical protein M422DRAFT_273415 [Sphaerobolus stellatus SS14]
MAAIDDDNTISLPPVLGKVSELVDVRPESFMLGDEEIRVASLQAAKYVFDLSLQSEQKARPSIADLLRSIEPATGRQTRSQIRAAENGSKKEDVVIEKTDEQIWKPTPLEGLLLDGMDDDQVWAQMELRTGPLCDILRKVVIEQEIEDEEGEGMDDGEELDMEDMEGMEGLVDDEEFDSDEEYYDEEGMDEDDDDDEEDDEEDEEDEEDDGSSTLGEDVMTLRDPSDEEPSDKEDNEDAMDLDRPIRPLSKNKKGKQRAGGHPVLDDGFFSLAEFNAETEEAESKGVSRGRLSKDEDDEDDEDLDDVDIFAPVEDEEPFEEEDLEGGFLRTSFEEGRGTFSEIEREGVVTPSEEASNPRAVQ